MGPFVLPEPTLRAVHEAPSSGATLLLLRHSARGPMPVGTPGNEVPLLPEGKALAAGLGRHIGARLVTLHTSPVLRCVETAEAIRAGAGGDVPIVDDTHLGHPGVYVEEGEAAWTTWRTLGHERVMEHLVAGDRLPGLADPPAASRRLLCHMRETAAGRPGIHVFVTHDSLVTTAAAHLLAAPLTQADWPWFLEALTGVVDGTGVTLRYRAWLARVPGEEVANTRDSGEGWTLPTSPPRSPPR